MDAKQLIQQLDQTDECNWIEAKKGSKVDRSILESICAFSNEPGIGGGYILLGVEREEHSLFPSYTVTGVENTDKIQMDLSSQCSDRFNLPVRPEITVERFGDKNVVQVYVPELADGQKPVYFKNEGLPRGAYRRIGSTDQRCTDDDLIIFYNNEDSFDSSIVNDASWEDISEEAIELYRSLRGKVNPYAEELSYSDEDLLHSLGCIKKKEGKIQITYAGLLLFGKRPAHRRLLPMVRADYIRVSGNEWVEDPEKRFTTIDMRGSLLEMVQRIFSQITDDLPKGFLLPEGELQAESIGLPSRVLREAIVNALIHRTYRENQPIQIIRYGNRLEIKNPGFSLKPEDHLGEPGSKNRNPYVAAVFHETNLAETKGSGIRTMRSLMEKASLLPPTFESDHSRNQFTARLLLHHFLGEEDVNWLTTFEAYELNDAQKRALIFTKEVGAIDNSVYRQVNSVDSVKASNDLRDLRKKDILLQKGKGKATYYVAGGNFLPEVTEGRVSTPPEGLSTPPKILSTLPKNPSTPPNDLSTPPTQGLYPPHGSGIYPSSQPFSTLPPEETETDKTRLFKTLSKALTERIEKLPIRSNEPELLNNLIVDLCTSRPLSSKEISILLGRDEKYLLRKFLAPLREKQELEYTRPEMPNHPDQAYKAVKK